jgi:hypothetical protein
MGDYVYRSYADLEALGRRVVEKAAEVTLWQDESYSQTQQDSINDYAKAQTPTTPAANPHYTPPASGDPDDPENVKAYVRSDLADLPRYFTAFSVPDPDAVGEVVTEPFYRTAGTLVPNLRLTRKNGGQTLSAETLADSGPYVETVDMMVKLITTVHMKFWTGKAAGAFYGYCLAHQDAAWLQNQLALDLAEAMEAHLELRRRQLTDVWNIGERTIQTLDALDSWCSRKKTTQNVLTVVGAIAAVAVVVSTEGVAAPVAAEGVQGLAAILAATPDPTPEPADISGATVPAVLQSMFDAIQKLHRRVDEQQQLLCQALTTLQSRVRNGRSAYLVPPPGDFTALAGADVGTLRTTFYDR